MRAPGWARSAGVGAAVLAWMTLSSCALASLVGAVARRLPEVGWIGTLARIPRAGLGEILKVSAVAGVGGALAGAAHRLAGRLLAIRPGGVYLRGVVLAEVYLFGIMGCLTALKGLGVAGELGRGDLGRGAPGMAALGLACGLLWGWLSRQDGVASGG